MPSTVHLCRLIRFIAKDGTTHYGDAILPPSTTDISLAKRARLISGSIFGTHTITPRVADIDRLLCPLAPTDVRTFRCLGLNYAKHAQESNMPSPKHPILFYKPSTSLCGPFDPIPVPKIAQLPRTNPTVDYECELVFVISRPGRDIPRQEARNHILGYCVGNDVSHREWQLKRGGGQWALGKSFDGWAPIGPGIVTLDCLEKEQGLDVKGLGISTRINGEVMQRSSIRDLIFGVEELVEMLSRGTTLQAGDVFFTGTPEGVGMGRRPEKWLKNGDVVEVELEGIGKCINRVEFEKVEGKEGEERARL